VSPKDKDGKKRIRFTFTPDGVAGLFLASLPPGGGGRAEQLTLGQIIEDAYNQGIYVGLERGEQVFKALHETGEVLGPAGFCKREESGSWDSALDVEVDEGEAVAVNCNCFCCQVEHAAEEVAYAAEEAKKERDEETGSGPEDGRALRGPPTGPTTGGKEGEGA